MKVFRLEHPDTGMGPYIHNWDHSYRIAADHSQPSHPGLQHVLEQHFHKTGEDVRFAPIEWWSACESLEALQDWFGEWWDSILDAGFVLVEKEVNPNFAIRGERGQVIFHLCHDAYMREVPE